MKQPPTPPEPRKVRGDYKPIPPTPPRVPATNPTIGGEPRKIHWDGTDYEVKEDFKIPFWGVLIAFIILVLGIIFFK